VTVDELMEKLMATGKPEAEVWMEDFLGHAWEVQGVYVVEDDQVHIVIKDTEDGELPDA